MSQLTASTRRRLRKLPQITSVWEGDHRPIQTGTTGLLAQDGSEGSCILWVDGSQGVVRAMDVVTMQASSHEATVRTLLQAMESPPHSALPARPQKIVVRDRELQFYLRGVLQELDIKVEFQSELPFIDEVYQSITELARNRTPRLPEAYADTLMEKAQAIWEDAPWDYLADHQILSVEINHWDITTLYISVMGMLGMEFGILLYRSLDSLRHFRQQVVEQEEENLEGAFLSQDCFYLTFSSDPASAEAEMEASFGLIHPLEGLRNQLYEEESLGLIVALEALHRFFRQHRRPLQLEFVQRTSRYRIPNPQDPATTLSIQVSTLTEIADEFEQDWDDEEDEEAEEDGGGDVVLNEDLIPNGASVGMTVLAWSIVESIRSEQLLQTPPGLSKGSRGLPVLIVQTTRPKAKALIETLGSAGFPRRFCFNTGTDPITQDRYDLKIMETANGELHLLGESREPQPAFADSRREWERQCVESGGYCGLIIAMGLSTSKGKGIQVRHMLVLYVMQKVKPEEIGLGPLVRIPFLSPRF